ncbi:MAG: M4 family metallopeptidase [Nocardioides sp.]|nr:M4 family metallopeptidase [Nocardioides sp.]
MRTTADGSVSITADPANGTVGFIRATGARADLLPGVAATGTSASVLKIESYLDRFATAFGATAAQLEQSRVEATDYGVTVTYAQSYQGLPVFGSGLKANVDKQGDLTAVTGFAVPDLDVSTDPAVTPAEAGARAVAYVKADPATDSEGTKTADTTGVEARNTELVVYRTGFLKGEAGPTVLAYAVEVTNDKNVRDQLIFDAQTGKILNRYSLMDTALNRELYEDSPDTAPVYVEGGDISALNPDQQNLVNSAGESYAFFENAFNRDSYDGEGATMKTVNNDPTISCPNANWNGTTTNYCDGVTSDDVVAHEWGHAYTEYTSGLIYQYQSGALNESYSDVWGETVDLVNNREDEGEVFEAKRPDGQCEPTAGPRLQMSITAPAEVAGPCTAAAAAFGPAFTPEPVTADVVVGTDAADPAGPATTDGCSTFTNNVDLGGNWVYVDRGACPFGTKIDNAEAAGATGIVVGTNNVDLPPAISGQSELYGVAVSQADGTRFKSVDGPVSVSVTAEDTSLRTDSTRWLVGEKSEAFGGAIRDMWTPTCYGDPGKVTDAEYKCDPTLGDAGGVHSNSGVPNHAYALAVDGGTYNGQSISPIGLDQTAAIWWRAQTAYLVPASNFTDAADGLEQSCTDLVGAPINTLTTEPDASPVAATPLTAADCAELAEILLAVEMRSPVVRCDFQPLLDKNTPSLCGPGFTTDTLYSENFEDGLAGWTPDQELASIPSPDGTYQGGFGAPWGATSSAPGGHATGVAYGPAPARGACSGNGVDDFSSRDSITGPTIEVPTGNLRNLSMSFEHYVAMEGGFDGGNVKLSVNGGGFTVIPAGAYTFNEPGQLFTLDQGNTNPMRGEVGFTGTDGGESKGSWGTSQIDLTSAGVTPGDTVQLRFDVGRDGCGGVEGWYLDNLQITVCKTAVALSAVHTPEPVAFGTPSSVQVSVERADGSVGANPTGTVVLRDPQGATIGEQVLNTDGDATFTLPGTTPAGRSTYTVDYLGTDTLAPASTPVTVTVTAPGAPGTAESTTKANAPGSVARTRTFQAKVTVKAEGTTPTGTVTIRSGGKTVGKGALSKGTVKIEVGTGRYGVGDKVKFTALYAGSATVAGSRDTFTVRILRQQ